MSLKSFHSPIGNRIVVVGATGSGKSTLAQSLSKALQIPHIELDDLHWEANWTSSPHFLDRVSDITARQKNGWIIDGNYNKARVIYWDQVDTVVWLDYPFWVVFVRLWCRCWRRWWNQTCLWSSGNIDSIWTHLFSPTDSLFVWLWKTHPSLYERYDNLRKSETAGNKQRKWVQLKSPGETTKWLDKVAQSRGLNKMD